MSRVPFDADDHGEAFGGGAVAWGGRLRARAQQWRSSRSGVHGVLRSETKTSEPRGGSEPTEHYERLSVKSVLWNGLEVRLRRRTAATGAAQRGLLHGDLAGVNGELGTDGELTRSTTEVAAGSGTLWWRRISSTMSRRPELGKTTVGSGWRLPPRFLLPGDEDDDERHAGHGGVAARGHWPRGLTAMATAALGKTFPEAWEARRRGMEVRGCPGGRGLSPYRDRGGREQVEAGPARQRRVHDGSRTGAGGGSGWGRRQAGVGWAKWAVAWGEV